MQINGHKIVLVPAVQADQEKIFQWLTQSDLTASMMGPPDFPEMAVPSWEEFCEDYPLSFFNDEGDGEGRNYIIRVDDQEIGTVGYDFLDVELDRVVLDIWMSSSQYTGHGYGVDALNTLCNYIHKQYGITVFLISPSARNQRAIAAYKKAGFVHESNLTKEDQEREFGLVEYDDNVLMVKRL